MLPTKQNRRLPAEWERQRLVQLTFPHEGTDWADCLESVLPCFLEIAAAISRYEEVLIVCRNANRIRPQLYGNTGNIRLIEAPSNDTWARDHGAVTILENERPVLLDFVFNGWGLKFPANLDNLITRRIYDSGCWEAEIRHGGLVLEGGGIESDGAGTLLTTSECLLSPNRNPHLNKEEIESRLKELFGLKQVLWLNHGYLAGDDTDSHIDTLARFCDPRTIAYVKCDDPDDEHYEALQKMEAELMAFRDLEGKPYNLVALPWPEAHFDDEGQRLPATYANFLIINDAVLVPVYESPKDAAALDIMRNLFPGREVIGINCNPLILQHGSLHCVTMQYPAELKFG
jgi:agmatine deiminase